MMLDLNKLRFGEEVHPELPKKKVLVSKDESTEIPMAEAALQSRQEP